MTNHSINYAQYIDHTLLAMDATEQQITAICQQALQHHFYSVCINSCYVPLVSKLLLGSEVKTCAVVGFPLGACLSEVKAFETQCAIAQGAQEIDMVINVGWFKSGDLAAVKADIQAVFKACGTVPLKVILETALLNNHEIETLCEMCREIGVAFVKTSTGFCSKGGASESAVALMRQVVGATIGVKASGGIRDRVAADKMIAAGANRLGTSAGVAIVTNEVTASSNY